MVNRDPGFFRISAPLSPWCVVLNFVVQDGCWSSSYHTYTPKSKMEEGGRIASYIQYKKTSETPQNIFTIYHFLSFSCIISLLDCQLGVHTKVSVLLFLDRGNMDIQETASNLCIAWKVSRQIEKNLISNSIYFLALYCCSLQDKEMSLAKAQSFFKFGMSLISRKLFNLFVPWFPHLHKS